MKYMLFLILAIVVCFSVGFGVTAIFRKRSRKAWPRRKTILMTAVLGLVLMIVAALGYLSISYHPDETALAAMNGSDSVTVRTVEGGYLFDGPCAEQALIFYPGAKVECRAYAPLMLQLAEAGIDCFLADMPFNLALFGSRKADVFMRSFDYDSWIMAGHSMGGLMACVYAAKHEQAIDGIVLLAAYPPGELPGKVRALSVYGSEDRCMDRDMYRKNTASLKDGLTEYVIEGGNHAQFGDYGKQSGDGDAVITPAEQQARTVEIIMDFLR